MTDRSLPWIAVALSIVLGGCDLLDQGSGPKVHKPGTYTGEKQKPLTDEQLRELRSRGLLQNG